MEHGTIVIELLGELMWSSRVAKAFTLKLELREVLPLIFGGDYVTTETLDQSLAWAALHAKMYKLEPAPNIKTITVKAFCSASCRQLIASYRQVALWQWHPAWQFSRDGDRDTFTANYLIWEEEKATATSGPQERPRAKGQILAHQQLCVKSCECGY